MIVPRLQQEPGLYRPDGKADSMPMPLAAHHPIMLMPNNFMGKGQRRFARPEPTLLQLVF
jgi:hypothetical protein